MSKFLWLADPKCEMITVFLSLRKTKNTRKEHILRIMGFVPKAANASDTSFHSRCQLSSGEQAVRMELTKLQLFYAYSSLAL